MGSSVYVTILIIGFVVSSNKVDFVPNSVVLDGFVVAVRIFIIVSVLVPKVYRDLIIRLHAKLFNEDDSIRR